MPSAPYSETPPRLFQVELWVAGNVAEAALAARAMAHTCGIGIQGDCVLPSCFNALGSALALEPLEKGYWPKREGGFLPVGGGLQMVQEEVSQWLAQWRQGHPSVSFVALLRRTDGFVIFESVVGSLLLDCPGFSSAPDRLAGLTLVGFGALGLASSEDEGVAWASVSKSHHIGQALLPVLLGPPELAYLRNLDLNAVFAVPSPSLPSSPPVMRF